MSPDKGGENYILIDWPNAGHYLVSGVFLHILEEKTQEKVKI